jgi:cardiolipin synthase
MAGVDEDSIVNNRLVEKSARVYTKKMSEIQIVEQPLYVWGLLYLVIELAGIYFALQAILTARSSQAAIAWAITLIVLPIIVLPLYWVFGSNRFFGYMESFRRATQEHMETAKMVFEEIEHFRVEEIDGLKAITASIKHLHSLPFTSNNSAQLLINGQTTYEAMLRSIDQSSDYVLLQFYIIHNDHVGETFRKVLTRKLRQGVRVYFLYDEIGSHRLSRQYLKELQKAGANVSSFSGHRGINKYLHINFRNHRKILIVDGLKAFVGGLNLGSEYLGEDETLGYWRDTHVMLEGPSVQALQTVFVKDWYWSQGEIPDVSWQIHKTREICQFRRHKDDNNSSETCNQNILILDTGPADEKPVCSLFLSALINQAERRVWIATPYFVPDQEIIQSLKNAALRGVEVTIILPEKHDNYLVYITSYAYYQELQGYQINIYRYTKGFSHQKVILIDDELAGIGTVNLDNRSIHLNFEVMAYVADRDFNSQVKAMLEIDISNCYLEDMAAFNDKPFLFHAVNRFFYLISPIL